MKHAFEKVIDNAIIVKTSHRNSVLWKRFGKWCDTAIFRETNRYHITAFGSVAAVFKLNISVGREVSALQQIKSLKRRRKRST